jgi:hypothetical protein
MKTILWAVSVWLSGIILCVQSAGQDKGAGKSVADVAGGLDLSVILKTWRVKGVMFCPKPCLWVENAYPSGIFEVTRQPFQSSLVGGNLFGVSGVTSSSHTDSSDGSASTLQFADSRVYTFIPPIELDLVIAKPQGPMFDLNYVSELDAFAYRTGFIDYVRHPKESGVLCDLNPSHPACAGRWGNFYPRIGSVIRDGEVLASYLTALRAGRAASDPWGRVVIRSYPFEPRVGHYLQMVDPVRRAAVPIGGDLAELERGAGARDGHYVFVHYGIFEACGKCLPARLVEARPVRQ